MGSNMRTSAIFAKLLQDEYRKTGRNNRGVHQQNFHVLRQVAMPSILTELGFISTPSEEAYLNSEQGINELATCIFNAFRRHISPILRDAGVSSYNEMATSHVNQAENEEVEIQATHKEETIKEHNKISSKQVSHDTGKPSLHSNETKRETITAKSNASTEKYEFRVQICTSDRRLRKDSEQFKGLADVNTYSVSLPNGKTQFVHTYGSSTSYAEIAATKNKLRTKFNDCFIVVFKDGKKITGEEAATALRKQP